VLTPVPFTTWFVRVRNKLIALPSCKFFLTRQLGNRPSIASNWNDRVQRVIQHSWAQTAAGRMSVKEARAMLETIQLDETFTPGVSSTSASLGKFIGAPKVQIRAKYPIIFFKINFLFSSSLHASWYSRMWKIPLQCGQ
jgi:hypothetical protein